MLTNERFLTLSDVIAKTSFSKTTIYRWISEGRFPRQIAFSAGCSRWSALEIEAWMEQMKNMPPAVQDNSRHVGANSNVLAARSA